MPYELLSGPPPKGFVTPPHVLTQVGGELFTPGWLNERGGLTLAIGDPISSYLKFLPTGTGAGDLSEEAERMRWCGRWLAVPEVLEYSRTEAGEFLVTGPVPGISAVDDRAKRTVEQTVRAIGKGLRVWHDTLPVEQCPFSWDIDDRLALAEEMNPEVAGTPEFQEVMRARQVVEAPDLVVGHGDACAPNTLVSIDGEFVGHVDLGDVGIADRWSDLSVAMLSLGWNYGPGWEETFLEAYGIDRDEQKIRLYQVLWELT